MVLQVHRQEEFTRMGAAERKDIWVSHKAALERYEVQFPATRPVGRDCWDASHPSQDHNPARSAKLWKSSTALQFVFVRDHRHFGPNARPCSTCRRMAGSCRNARLAHTVYRSSRGLKRAQIEPLRAAPWIQEHRNCLITGPTGTGKTYLAWALGAQACRAGYGTRYFHAPKLFRALEPARADGSLLPLLKKLARAPLIIADDLGIVSHRQFLRGARDGEQLEAGLLWKAVGLALVHVLCGPDEFFSSCPCERASGARHGGYSLHPGGATGLCISSDCRRARGCSSR